MTGDARAKLRFVEESFSNAAPVYDRSPSFAEPGRHLVEALRISPGEKVLDIATGRGAVLFPAVERVGPSGYVQGIDLAKPMVDATMADIVSRGLTNASVRRMNAEHIEFDDASFDAVSCGFALWFIPNLRGALAEMRRVIKPAGRFAATTWAAPAEIAAQLRRILSGHGIAGEALASHKLDTPEALAAVLRDGGFQSVSSEYVELTSVLKDAEDWWQRLGSAPQMYADLGSEEIEAVHQEAVAMAQAFASSDGSISITRQFVLATAVSP